MTQNNHSPIYGRRNATSFIDQTAKENPDKLYGIVSTRTGSGLEFQEVTYGDLSRAISRAAWWFEQKLGKGSDYPCIAYLGPSDIRYVFFAVAANKVGYKILFPSPRNSTAYHLHILEESKCSVMFKDESTDIGEIKAAKQDLKEIVAPSVEHFLSKDPVDHYPYVESDESPKEPTIVLHSSGSTGPPKVIQWTQENLSKFDAQHNIRQEGNDEHLACSLGKGKILNSLPLFHATAQIVALGHALFYDQPSVFPPVGQVNASTILETIKKLDVKTLLIAPSVLEDMAHDDDTLEMLKGYTILYGGGPLGDKAGDVLCKHATVHAMIGTTESGEFPLRTDSEKSWNYFHYPTTLKGIQFRKHNDELFEMVFVRDEETDRYHSTWITFPDLQEYSTKDLYSKHPTVPNLWRHRGRSDDTIAFSNGEKFVPIPYELRLKDAPEVHEVLLAGQGQFEVCALIELSETAQGHPREQVIDQIMPTIKKVNSDMPRFARISKDRLIFTSPDKPMVQTAKGSIIRKATLKLYEKEIHDLYEVGGKVDPTSAPLLKNTTPETTTKSLITIVTNSSDISREIDVNQNLFELGFDSLNVMTVVRAIKGILGAEGNSSVKSITPSMIYAHPTIQDLTETLRALDSSPQDQAAMEKMRIQEMDDMLTKYSKSIADERSGKVHPVDSGLSVILTGSTGSLGSYLLDSLSKSDKVTTVYALNRSETGSQRQVKASSSRQLGTNFAKVKFLKADLSRSDLGLSKTDYEEISKNTHLILHNQWAVDFNLSLQSMEPHVAGISNLVDLAVASANHPYILFTSSVGTLGSYAEKHPEEPAAPELIFNDSSIPQPLGYTMSKQIGERILDLASQRTGLRTSIARLGQIAGPVDRKGGVWNKQEWLPSLIISSAYLKLLPSDMNGDIDWIPVDILADVLVELALRDVSSKAHLPQDKAMVYNLINPTAVQWSDMVPAILADLPKETKVVSMQEWVEGLRASSEEQQINTTKNPAIKLLDFYANLAEGAEVSAKMQVKNALHASPTFKALGPVSGNWMDSWMNGWDLM